MGVRILNTKKQLWRGALELSLVLGDRGAETSDHAVLFDRYDQPGRREYLLQQLLVEWFDCVHVHDPNRNSLPFQQLGSLKGLVHNAARGHDDHIVALLEPDALTNHEIVVAAVHNRVRNAASESQVGRPFVICEGKGGFDCLRAIGRRDHGHVRDCAHEGQILQAHVGRSEGPHREPSSQPHEFDAETHVTHIDPNGIRPTGRGERRVGGGEHVESLVHQTGSNADHVLLSDTDIHEAIRIGGTESIKPGEVPQVGGQYQDVIAHAWELHGRHPERAS